MKRLLAAFILVIFLFNIMGYYFVFSYNQYLVRTEMNGLIKTGCFDSSFIILKILNPGSNKEFRRINKEEFEYMGLLYDIVTEKREGNFTVFRCINDKNEEKLLAGFHRYCEFTTCQNNPVKTKHTLALLYHVIKHALPQKSSDQCALVLTEISFINPIYPLSSIFYRPAAPPPKFA